MNTNASILELNLHNPFLNKVSLTYFFYSLNCCTIESASSYYNTPVIS